MKKPYVVVVGGMNMDIFGMPNKKIIPRDSNIGQIGLAVGGVGQNIAQNLAHLHVPTYLITVYGDDMNGAVMKQECDKNNINLDYAMEEKGQRSSGYMYITDETGDMLVGINDMKICENITPEFLNSRLNFMNNAELVMIDANLSTEAIKWLGNNLQVPIFVDPVSVSKAERIKPILSKIDTLKPNKLEAELLTGIKIKDDSDVELAARKLIQLGVKNVFISLGSNGILAANEEGMVHVGTLTTNIVNANGAGDCSTATIAWCRYQGINDLKEICLNTQAAASIALESEKSVPDITPQQVEEKLETAKALNY
ncbi:carbohydrate kinase family protein [Limosilactobacillus reuteri]|uniref:Carbohydrate kinase n=1 Tax=Limosilactobacillus reuteri TaxID=1598 RepID=A0AB36AC30_LIMRT|nr:carbohydrate kinase family protein [Limosilactobacillus reuteri]MCH5357229.1 carbohydrate kinase family protein [Limosilactobacillus reuteri]MRG83429.1 carbohydrate kinase [Limosilactobacillus reuteri]